MSRNNSITYSISKRVAQPMMAFSSHSILPATAFQSPTLTATDDNTNRITRKVSRTANGAMECESTSFGDGADLQQQRHCEKPMSTSKMMVVDIHTSISAVPSHDAIEDERRQEAVERQKLLSELKSSALALFEERRDLPQAEEIFRHVLHLLHQQSKPDDNETIATLANIGKCCELTGRLQEAMSCYKDALHMKTHQDLLQESPDVKLMLASILYDIGMIHSKLLVDGSARNGALAEKAVKAFSLALKLRQDCLGENHHAVASVLHNIGAVLAATERPGAAIGYHERALTIRRMALGPGHPEVASSLRHLATAHKALGRYQAASAFLSEALQILRCIPGEAFLQEVIIELSHVQRALLQQQSNDQTA